MGQTNPVVIVIVPIGSLYGIYLPWASSPAVRSPLEETRKWWPAAFTGLWMAFGAFLWPLASQVARICSFLTRFTLECPFGQDFPHTVPQGALCTPGVGNSLAWMWAWWHRRRMLRGTPSLYELPLSWGIICQRPSTAEFSPADWADWVG